MKDILAFLVLAFVLPCSPLLLAKEKGAEKPSADTHANNEHTNDGLPAKSLPTDGKKAQQEFDRILKEWKPLLFELRELRSEFNKAVNDEQRKDIKRKYSERIERGNELVPTLIKAAEQAYIAKPNENKEVLGFLVEIFDDSLRHDQLERAVHIGSLLADNDAPQKRIAAQTGMIAFRMQDSDTAYKYLTMAKKNKVLSNKGELFLSELEIQKKEAEKDNLPRVELVTNKGKIVIELFEDQAPNTVANFISLIEKGFYDGIIFHRVLPHFMAQGGDPTGTGSGGPGYSIECECYRPDHRLNFRGTISMAHAGRNTGGSQFFLNTEDNAHLDGKHTAFGRIIEGMDVVDSLQLRDPQSSPPLPEADKIISAKVLRKQDHPYEPKTLPGR